MKMEANHEERIRPLNLTPKAAFTSDLSWQTVSVRSGSTVSCLAREPTKLRLGYAKFEVAQPPLNLTLNENSAMPLRPGTASHFGVQVKSTAEVKRMTERFQQAGMESSTEESVACCYAVQDKVWVSDPDGNALGSLRCAG